MSFRKKKRRKKGIVTGVSQEMTSVLRRLGTGTRDIHPELWARWHEIVGADLAKRTLPRRLNGKTLILAVASSAWMHELSYLRQAIVERIEEEVGFNVVRRIRLILDTEMPVRPSLPPPSAPVVLPNVPLPTEIVQAVDRVADPELRKLILKAARANIK